MLEPEGEHDTLAWACVSGKSEPETHKNTQPLYPKARFKGRRIGARRTEYADKVVRRSIQLCSWVSIMTFSNVEGWLAFLLEKSAPLFACLLTAVLNTQDHRSLRMWYGESCLPGRLSVLRHGLSEKRHSFIGADQAEASRKNAKAPARQPA